MTKIAIIGDMHLGVKSGDPNFLEFQMQWLEQICMPYCRANNITHLIQTGDMYDTRSHIKLNVMSESLYRLPQALRAGGITDFTTYAGNHDVFYRDDNSVCSLDLLARMDSYYVQFHVFKDEIGRRTYGGKSFAFVPWLNKKNQERILSELAETKVDYVFGHFDIVGMPMYRGILADSGLDPDVFRGFTRVISGHYHTVSEYKNIQYVGTPYHLTWMDYPDGIDRGFWVLDTADNSLELIQNPSWATMFSVIEYDPEFKYEDDSFDEYEGNVVKVMVDKKPVEKHYKKFVEILTKTKFLDYKIIDTTMVSVEKVTVSEAALATDTSAAITEYIDKQEDDGIDKEEVKKLATSIFVRATTK